MKNGLCNSLRSGYGTGKLVNKRPVHLLLMEGGLGSQQGEGAHGRMQRGDMRASESLFPED